MLKYIYIYICIDCNIDSYILGITYSHGCYPYKLEQLLIL